MSKKLGWFIITILAFIPVLIWSLIQPPSTRFVNAAVTTTSIGQLAALIGITLLGITFLLNTRLKFIENLFGGLDKVYKAHHLLGTTAFLFLLSHPLFLGVKYALFSLSSLTSFLFFGLNLATDFGEFALLAMILSLAFTFFITLKYDKWKIIHQFLGLALLFASIHVLLLTSDISRNAILKAYVLIFVAIGMLSFCYRTLFHTKLIKKYKYNIKEIKHLGKITEIKLQGESFNYLPGQFVFVKFPSISYEYHPFTISSIKNENHVTVSIKSSGDYTEKIKGLKIGDMAFIEGPYGRFYPKGKEQVWIAGGIGITPFLSFAKSLKDEEVDLFYSVKNKDEAVYLKELEEIAEKKKNFRIIPIYSLEQGRINAEFLIKKVRGDIKNKEIFMCGPIEMTEALKKDFIVKEIRKNKIYFEEFNLR